MQVVTYFGVSIASCINPSVNKLFDVLFLLLLLNTVNGAEVYLCGWRMG